MKTTILQIIIITSMIFSTLSCTNKKNKTETVIMQNDVYISNDTSAKKQLVNNSICDKVWYFYIINSTSIEQYITVAEPYMIISNDSSYVYLNSGCNIYLGECDFKTGNAISFHKILIKDEICPIDAIEREIVYTLDLCNNYTLSNNTLTLYHNNNIIGLLITNNLE